MLKICILTDGFKINNKSPLIYPFYVFKNELLNNKILFHITDQIQKIKQNDVLITDSKFFYYEYSKDKINNTIKIIKKLKKKTKKFVYFDTSDSTGPIELKIIPYVDLYLKHQIFKYKKNYSKKLYGGRLYTHHYNLKNKIKDFEPTFQNKIHKKFLNKIKVGWNIGLSDYTIFSIIKFKFYEKLNFLRPKKFLSKNYFYTKNLDYVFNCNLSYRKNTIGFQRNFLSKFFFKNNKKIFFFKYYKILKKSLVSISPFGWGEINYRDFEAIICKSVLFKPNMDHIETWPNFFIKNVTYIDFNWNMKDTERKLNKLINNKKKCFKISTQALKNYKKYTSDKNAGNLFAKRLINLFS